MELDKLKISNLRKKHEPHKQWSDEARVDAVSKWLVLGNLRLVAELTGVSYDLIRQWKISQWWKDLEAEIRASRDNVVDTKLSKIVDKSLQMIEDRLENGDVVYNRKTGEVSRRPAGLETINKVAKTALEQQKVLADKESVKVDTVNKQTVQEQIKFLAEEFAKFNTRRTVDIQARTVNAVHDEWEAGLQEATEVRLEAGEHPQESRGQQGSQDDGEGRESTQGGWQGRGSPEAAEQGWEDDDEQSSGSESAHQSFIRPDLQG